MDDFESGRPDLVASGESWADDADCPLPLLPNLGRSSGRFVEAVAEWLPAKAKKRPMDEYLKRRGGNNPPDYNQRY